MVQRSCNADTLSLPAGQTCSAFTDCHFQFFRLFHDEMLKGTSRILSGDRHILHRMKEIWFYLVFMFKDADKAVKQIRKSEHMNDYLAAVDALFRECEIANDAGFRSAVE